MIDLDGAWQFATDPSDGGEREQWFLPRQRWLAMPLAGYASQANGQILVPGCWDAQGYGEGTDKMRHQFNGVGWYRKRVKIPRDWGGRRIFLEVGGVMRSAKTWINGVFLGEHIGYLSDFKYEITSRVVPGEVATITLAVDSRWHADVDPLMGCGTFMDYMGDGFGKSAGYGSTSEATWGGIWGHVRLEAHNPAWLDQVFVQSRLSPPSCRITAALRGRVNWADAVRVQVRDSRGVLASKTFPLSEIVEGTNLTISAGQMGEIPGVQLWSFRHPQIYTVGLVLLKDSQPVDEVDTRTGFRQIEVNGDHFMLNGKPIFLNGYGDDAIYPGTIAWPVNKAFYIKRLKLIKSYGFNYVRLHSHFLPDEFYQACDQLGMMVQVEAPLAYGYRATNATARETYLKEWRKCILRYRNHPSIITWCGGNEGSGVAELGSQFEQIARSLGGDRLFIATDGVNPSSWEHGAGVATDVANFADNGVNSNLMDFLPTWFDVTESSLDVPNKFAFSVTPARPVVSHEEGNDVTFPRFDQIAQFDQHSDIKPFWLTWGQARYARLGLLEQTPRWAENSERLYYQLHKQDLESLHLNPRIAGYDWWLFQDFWTTDNGLVDAFYRSKSIKPESVLEFNNDIVLLQEGLKRTYRSEKKLTCRLYLSNYGDRNLHNQAVSWRLRLDGETLTNQELRFASANMGQLAEIGGVNFALPSVARPRRLTLEIKMRVGHRRIFNHWHAWLYPSHIAVSGLHVPLYADTASLPEVAQFGAQSIPPGSCKPVSAVYVCGRVQRLVLEAIQRGAWLILLSPPASLPTEVSRYKLPWWRASGDNNVDEGTEVYNYPTVRKMAPEGWCGSQWYELIDGARGMLLDALPQRQRPVVLIRGIDAPIDPHDKAFLWMARIGQGGVIVSGLNHRRARGLPINDWLLARLVELAASRPSVSVFLPTNYLQPAFEGHGFPGFARVLKRGEVTTWYSYREDNVHGFFCRETSPTNVVEWETAPLPRDWRGKRATFVFAGGMGYKGQPDAGGFTLSVNGKSILDFNLAFKSTNWWDINKQVKLRFEVNRRLSSDALGLFSLTLPKTMLRAGKPCVLSVCSKGSGSRRWFGLYPYVDLGDR